MWFNCFIPPSQYIYVIQWFYFPESVYICDSMVLFPRVSIYMWFNGIISPQSVYICDSMVLFPRVSIYMWFNGFIPQSQYIYVIQWFYFPESVYICDSMVLFPRVSIYMWFNGFISPSQYIYVIRITYIYWLGEIKPLNHIYILTRGNKTIESHIYTDSGK
jgi:triacylglycerol esterase/lipase EstA (alpha/beta hydrolase family)